VEQTEKPFFSEKQSLPVKERDLNGEYSKASPNALPSPLLGKIYSEGCGTKFFSSASGTVSVPF
jgi:hypothetical protein